MTATDPPTGGDAVRRRTTAPLPSACTRPRLRGRGDDLPPGVIPDSAERRSGTSDGLTPAARGPGPPPEPGEEIDNRAASCPKRLQHMNSGHAEHDIS